MKKIILHITFVPLFTIAIALIVAGGWRYENMKYASIYPGSIGYDERIAAIMGYHHMHSPYFVYPDLANDIQAVCGIGSWELGALTTVIPFDYVDSVFSVTCLNVSNVSVTDLYQVNIYMNEGLGEVRIASVKFMMDKNTDGNIDIHLPSPMIADSSRISIQAASKSGGGDVVDVSLTYQRY